jgi:hypothetical protein
MNQPPPNRNILRELENLLNREDVTLKDIEMRASHTISSVIHLFDDLSRYYNEEQSQDLQRKMLSCIRNRDVEKFMKYLQKVNREKNK